LRALRSARYVEAEQHYRAALTRLTAKYTTPKDAAPFYYLGVALRAQGRNDEAYDTFFKATWSQEWKAPAYFSLAELATARGDFTAALDLINHSLDANALSARAYGLKAALLRHQGLNTDAVAVIQLALRKTDPLDPRLVAEQWLTARHKTNDAETRILFTTLNTHPATAQELAAEYTDAGLWQDGLDILERAIDTSGASADSPILHYYLGDFAERLGKTADAANYRRSATQKSPTYVFPFQVELIPVLQRAIASNPADAHAPYYLGNLLFDLQPTEAIALWEKSAALDPSFPTVWRNLAQAYAHATGGNNLRKAIAALEKAVALPNPDPTHLAELDALYAEGKTPTAKRLALLESHQPALLQHDESLARLINLKTFAGKTDEAIALLSGHTFNIWEGGTRFNTAESWIDAHLVRGQQHFRAKHFREAQADFEAATKFPANLRANDTGARSAEIDYWIGCAQDANGETAKAVETWRKAVATNFPARTRASDVEIAGDLFRRSSQLWHQGLALRKLARNDEAEAIFKKLVHPSDPAASTAGVTSAAHYAAGLGYAGLGEMARARQELETTLSEFPDHLAAKLALENIER
jgi:tetratricopeptide (TPR) repeat protein